MRKRMKLGRPSHATVVAYLALFVALGGVSYAAIKLPKNSVGTKQIKKNAVTAAKIRKNAVTAKKIKKNAVTAAKIRKNAVNSAKVKNNSLTGADINLNKLGTVPSANVANSANALAPAEAPHIVGAPAEPPFEPGSVPLASTEGLTPRPVGFFKDHEGIVHLQGVAELAAEEGPIFTLPPGYRPATGITDAFLVSKLFVFGPGTSVKGKDVSGKVYVEGSKYALLDGITFRAES